MPPVMRRSPRNITRPGTKSNNHNLIVYGVNRSLLVKQPKSAKVLTDLNLKIFKKFKFTNIPNNKISKAHNFQHFKF